MEKQLCRNEDEYTGIVKILDFKLSHKFKKIGYIGAILILAFLLGYKLLGYPSMTLIIKDVFRTLILLFLLIASLSKDSFEDEFNKHVRFQSYVVGFVFALVYSISIPFIAFIFDLLITKITGNGVINFHETSSFEVMFILICIQLLCFETLKKLGRV